MELVMPAVALTVLDGGRGAVRAQLRDAVGLALLLWTGLGPRLLVAHLDTRLAVDDGGEQYEPTPTARGSTR